MRIRTLALAVGGLLTVSGALLFATLDKETRALLLVFPTNSDVLSWDVGQRDTAFRAMDRLPVLVRATQISASPSPLPLPAGTPLTIPGVVAYMVDQRTAGLVIIHDGKVRFERYGLDFDAHGRWTSFSVAKCCRSPKTDHLCALKIDQGWSRDFGLPAPPV